MNPLISQTNLDRLSRITGALVLGCSLGACASLKGEGTSKALTDSVKSEASIAVPVAKDDGIATKSGPSLAVRTEIPRDWTIGGVKLAHTQFDIPVENNTLVEEWVDYFTGRGRKHYEVYLRRSEIFIPFLQKILRANGMPEDLVYLAMIESGFNNHARSRAKAVGPWQFMAATGRRYGLNVNWWVDERRDIRRSTLAAVEYLRDLHGVFNSWELAAAAYNAGEMKIAKAIQRFGVQDFWTLGRQRYLKPETRHYVPKMMAAAIVAKNRTLFGFPASYQNAPAPSEAEVAEADEAIGGVAAVVKNEEEVEDSKDGVAPTPAPGPTAATQRDKSFYAAAPPVPLLTKAGEISGKDVIEFEVESPADLSRIAGAAGLTYAEIKALNPSVLRWCTPPGIKTFRIKIPAHAKDRFLSNYNHPAYPRAVQFRTVKAGAGESPRRIAQRLGISPEPVLELNGWSSPNQYVRPGSLVLVPMPMDRTRSSAAALDLIDPPSGKGVRRAKKRRAMRVGIEERKTARVSTFRVSNP